MADFISSYVTVLLFAITMFILFGGVIYLIMRPLVLWYFKIYTIVSELQENNALLRGILEELTNRNVLTPSSHQPKEDHSKYMPK